VGFILYLGAGNADWVMVPIFATQVGLINVGLGNDVYVGGTWTPHLPTCLPDVLPPQESVVTRSCASLAASSPCQHQDDGSG
jgi:hypothetical protein